MEKTKILPHNLSFLCVGAWIEFGIESCIIDSCIINAVNFFLPQQPYFYLFDIEIWLSFIRGLSMSCSKSCRCSDLCSNRPFRKDKKFKIVKVAPSCK